MARSNGCAVLLPVANAGCAYSTRAVCRGAYEATGAGSCGAPRLNNQVLSAFVLDVGAATGAGSSRLLELICLSYYICHSTPSPTGPAGLCPHAVHKNWRISSTSSEAGSCSRGCSSRQGGTPPLHHQMPLAKSAGVHWGIHSAGSLKGCAGRSAVIMST
jgi:hypothetical protein